MDITMLKEVLGEQLYMQVEEKLGSLEDYRIIAVNDENWVLGSKLESETQKRKELQSRIDTLTDQLNEAQSAMAGLQDAQTKAEQLALEVADRDAVIAALKRSDKVREALTKANIRDAVIGEKLLDMSRITEDSTGRLKGLDEQIKALREASPYLFMDPMSQRVGFEAHRNIIASTGGTDDHSDVNYAIRAAAGRN